MVRAARPILVTGSHRSGTTWVGSMIACAPGIVYFSEPFNPERRDVPVRQWWHRVTPETAAAFRAYLRPYCELSFPWWDRRTEHPASLLGRLHRHVLYARRRAQGARPLVKDPIALLSAEWLAEQYQAQPIVLIRHPAAFTSSVKRLGWLTPAADLLRQPAVMSDWLRPLAGDLERIAARPDDIIDHAIVGWNALHHVIRDFQERHPEWLFCRHEDVSRHPLREFARLFEWLGLDFTDDVVQAIERHSGADNPCEADGQVHQLQRNSAANIWNWQARLTADEIARVRAGTRALAEHFYGDADWWSARTSAA
ncbi:MAG: sulfotransferase [Gemmataceae bacterium]|nr:sulfotransferase [Gemmataceae bacterium]